MRAGATNEAAVDEWRRLLERESELKALDAVIGAVGRGGWLLALEDPPGVGKTSVVGEAFESVEERGNDVPLPGWSEVSHPALLSCLVG